jgi:hypothetical protein
LRKDYLKSFQERAQGASTLVDSILLIGAVESELCKVIDENENLLEMDQTDQKQLIDT